VVDGSADGEAAAVADADGSGDAARLVEGTTSPASKPAVASKVASR
jgi:hypothetical protein